MWAPPSLQEDDLGRVPAEQGQSLRLRDWPAQEPRSWSGFALSEQESQEGARPHPASRL